MPQLDDVTLQIAAGAGVAIVAGVLLALGLRLVVVRRRARRVVRIVGVGRGGAATLAALMGRRRSAIECIALDSDHDALRRARAHRRIAIGTGATGGDGLDALAAAGTAAREATDILERALAGSSLVVLTGGLGGATASGVIPVVAEIARRSGALTVAVVTTPFRFEGGRRGALAADALRELTGRVDAVAVLPNERMRESVPADASVDVAFRAIDDTVRSTIQAVVAMAHRGARLGLDIATARTALRDAGGAFVGVGRAVGPERAPVAAREAIAMAVLDAETTRGGSVVMNIAASRRLRLSELDAAVQEVRAAAGSNADVELGLTIDRRFGKALQVTVIVAGQQAAVETTGRRADSWLPVWRRDRNEPLSEEPPSAENEPSRPVTQARRGRRRTARAHDVASGLAG